MKLLLDEHLSPAIAKGLRDRDQDVVAISERPECIQLSDDQVIDLARSEQRTTVTNNLRDYRPRAAALVTASTGHFGMVSIPATYRRTRADTGRIITALQSILDAHPAHDGLRNAEAWLV